MHKDIIGLNQLTQLAMGLGQSFYPLNNKMSLSWKKKKGQDFFCLHC